MFYGGHVCLIANSFCSGCNALFGSLPIALEILGLQHACTQSLYMNAYTYTRPMIHMQTRASCPHKDTLWHMCASHLHVWICLWCTCRANKLASQTTHSSVYAMAQIAWCMSGMKGVITGGQCTHDTHARRQIYRQAKTQCDLERYKCSEERQKGEYEWLGVYFEKMVRQEDTSIPTLPVLMCWCKLLKGTAASMLTSLALTLLFHTLCYVFMLTRPFSSPSCLFAFFLSPAVPLQCSLSRMFVRACLIFQSAVYRHTHTAQ